MSDDVFSNAPTGEPQKDTALIELVGDDKKFKTVELLAEGKKESDAFIVKLQEENKQALDALTELQGKDKDSATVSELIAAMKDAQNKPTDDGKPALSEEDLSKLVRSIVQGDSAAAVATKNREEANSLVLQKVGGDKELAKTYVADRAKALGITTERLGELSEESPSAFAELLGLKRTAAPNPGITNIQDKTPSPDVSTRVLQVDGHNTKAHYDALKKELGVAKFLGDHKIQVAMLKDAMALGMERFNT